MRTLVILACIAGVPAGAFGQAAISGSVTDAVGTTLPGVVVEASSAALIERTRSAVTDGAGRYRIQDLRPGTYQVRFTLQGWKGYARDGIELTGSITAVIDARLAMGTTSETVTVSGVSPILDIRSATREVTLTGGVVQTIPTARSYNALLVLIPGVSINSNDTVTGTASASFPIHGGRTNEGRLSLDGLTIGSPPSGNSATSYTFDVGQAQEVTFTTAGALGEVETGGLVMNVVPKSGGNTRRGSFFASGSGEKLQSSNVTPELAAQGVMAAASLTKVYDLSGSFGGPIVADRLWYFLNAHT
jgi:hypothetical protein